MKALTVTEPFAGYAKGDQITDAQKITDVLLSNPNQVVNVILPDPEPAPAPVAKPAPAAPVSDAPQV